MALLAGIFVIWPALSLGMRLGPQNCVSLSRSDAGTCVIKNSCENVDTSKYEYAFDCWNSPQDLVRHSFGVGGFAADEEFDTEIQCKRCEPPADLKKLEQAAIPVKGTKSQSLVAAKTTKRAKPPVAKYGPGKCVSTWRQEKSSHCIVMTNCTNEDMDNYEYGLICKDKDGEVMKHLFGKNSFDPEEIFDTLLVCAECDGIDESSVGKLNETMVAELEADVKEISGMLKNATKAVAKLNQKVFGTTTKKPTLPPAPKLLLHKKSRRQRPASKRHREVRVPPAPADEDTDDALDEDAGSEADEANVGESEVDEADSRSDGAEDEQ